MATIPAALALRNIGDGTSIIASDHRNNYDDIESFVNELRTILASGAAGQLLQSAGATEISWSSAGVHEPGDVKWSARRTPSSGWLKCDGSAVSRSAYADLFDAIVPSLGTVTVTIASPGVFTRAAHGLVVGDKIYLTTTGALPTGLTANTIYYVVSTPSADTFTVSATDGGSAINTSGSQSGTHTLRLCPFGLGDGSTTFNLPPAGRTLVTPDTADPAFRALGKTGGSKDSVAAHTHTIQTQSISLQTGGTGFTMFPTDAPVAGPSTNSGGTDDGNLQPYVVLNLFIKT